MFTNDSKNITNW